MGLKLWPQAILSTFANELWTELALLYLCVSLTADRIPS